MSNSLHAKAASRAFGKWDEAPGHSRRGIMQPAVRIELERFRIDGRVSVVHVC